MLTIERALIESGDIKIELEGNPKAIVDTNGRKFRYLSSIVVSTKGLYFGCTEAIVTLNEYDDLEIFKSNDWEYGDENDYSWDVCGDNDKFVLQDGYGFEFLEIIDEVRKLIGNDEEKNRVTITKFEDIFPE